MRARLRKPVQTVALEPFADTTDKAAMDINSLSLSADGLYLAAGRTDNWVDVYDARALGRGPLHAFAHEESDKPDRRAMYGIVKTEWVSGAPYGVGLVSGGADGMAGSLCVMSSGRWVLTCMDVQAVSGCGTCGGRRTIPIMGLCSSSATTT